MTAMAKEDTFSIRWNGIVPLGQVYRVCPKDQTWFFNGLRGVFR